MFLTFPCFSLVVLHFLHVFAFFVIGVLFFFSPHLLSLVFFAFLLVFLHSPHFSLFFIGVPCFSIGLSCMFVTFSYLFMDSPCSPIICHLSSFIFINCSCCLLVFLRPNLAFAVAAAIASVALLVAVVIVVVVNLRHDGFKNKEREGGWGGGRGASPQGVGRV